MDQSLHTTPIGLLRLTASSTGLRRIELPNQFSAGDTPRRASPNRHLAAAALQLDRYFAGESDSFDLELDPQGTPFQQSVWNALLTIPHGATATYGEIARQIGQPNAARAVGMANNRNPIPIVIPCHRVIGATGKLVGYAGEVWRKEFLLNLERQRCPLLA